MKEGIIVKSSHGKQVAKLGANVIRKARSREYWGRLDTSMLPFPVGFDFGFVLVTFFFSFLDKVSLVCM